MNRGVHVAAAIVAGAAIGCATGARRVEGTLIYRERIVLPPGAYVTVQLVDTTVDTLALLDEMRFRTSGEQVPFPFRLEYDPEDIARDGALAVEARIESFGQVLFRTPAPQAVSRDSTGPFEVMLEQATPEETDVKEPSSLPKPSSTRAREARGGPGGR